MKSNKKQIISILAVLTMALVLSCALVACNKTDSPDAPKKEFTITFDTQGGSEVKPITIAEGATITLPRNPTKEGYIFDGWFLSDEFIEKFNATQTISSNITVYAKWKEDYYSKGLNYELINDKREYAVAGIGTCTDKELIIPSEYNAKPVTSIGKDAFFHCTGLTSVTIPDSVTSIGYSAFDGCTGLTSVTIGGSVTSIGSYAFDGCSEIASISGSSDVISKVAKQSSPKSFVGNITSGTSVMAGAFSGMTGLTSVTIPDSVTSIGDDAFYGCNNLQDIYITDIVAWCYIAGLSSLMYNGASNKKLYINNELATSITLPDGVKAISSYAFYNCTGLTSITIPNSVTSIGEVAFNGCSKLQDIYITDIAAWCNISGLYSLMGYSSSNKKLYINNKLATSITIPNGVTSIGNYAFSYCSGLTSVTIPNSVTSIGSYAFNGCTGLTRVTIPGSVTSIGAWSFGGCKGLTSITIPDSVTSIDDYAFWDCTGLTSITFKGTIEQWNAISKGSAWEYRVPATQVVCTDGTTSI